MVRRRGPDRRRNTGPEHRRVSDQRSRISHRLFTRAPVVARRSTLEHCGRKRRGRGSGRDHRRSSCRRRGRHVGSASQRDRDRLQVPINWTPCRWSQRTGRASSLLPTATRKSERLSEPSSMPPAPARHSTGSPFCTRAPSRTPGWRTSSFPQPAYVSTERRSCRSRPGWRAAPCCRCLRFPKATSGARTCSPGWPVPRYGPRGTSSRSPPGNACHAKPESSSGRAHWDQFLATLRRRPRRRGRPKPKKILMHRRGGPKGFDVTLSVRGVSGSSS